MEVTYTMGVDAMTLMEHLKQSIRNDVKEANKNPQQVKEGFTYSKQLSNKFGQSGYVTVEILTFSDLEYAARFKTTQGVNTLKYTLLPVDDHECILTYTEQFESHKKLNELNYKLSSFLFKRRSKRRVQLLLASIENYLIEKKGEKRG